MDHDKLSEPSPRRILLAGAGGLIGTALIEHLSGEGHVCTRLVRGGGTPAWNPEAGALDPAVLSGYDAVVHLGGETIQALRWTAAKKRRILDTRVKSTALLAENLARCDAPPKVFLCASAIGFYGDRGTAELDEHTEAGSGFMAEVCRAWEAAAQPAADVGIRVVNLRIGLVLSMRGGALPPMVRAFRLGLGGRIAGGGMYMSWISLEDLVRAAAFCLDTPRIEDPVNAVAPNPVTNAEWTRELGHAVCRPTLFPVPGFAIRAGLGEMGRELLLSSTRVEPGKLKEAGFTWRHETLAQALHAALGD